MDIDKVLDALGRYEAFFHEARLARSNQIPYMVRWVKRFLTFRDTMGDQGLEEAVTVYISGLEGIEEVADWQVRQAEAAVRIFIYQFRAREKIPELEGRPAVVDACETLEGVHARWLRTAAG